jgi:hypothetical protein
MQFDLAQFLAQVDWLYVVILAVFVFVACLIGNLVAFGNRMTAAMISTLLFAVAFIGWTYYPHGLPLPTSLASKTPPVMAAPAPVVPVTPPAPVRPANPVRDITPPRQ